MTFKPMLAAAAPDDLRFPMLASPKLDGIRCLIIDGVACGRSLKPIPNRQVQNLFGHHSLNGLDGELIVGDPTAKDVFQRTTSGVMARDGLPDVKFHAFDNYLWDYPFERRLSALQRMGAVGLVHVPHRSVISALELASVEQKWLAQGYEGVMLRAPDGPYKHGRSTAREGWLLKLKRFTDSEAIIVGSTELMHNGNEATVNALGHTERSSHKAGKVGRGMLGALTVQDVHTGVVFEIGAGFTDAVRRSLWAIPDDVLRTYVVKYKFQAVGVKDKPRFPVFLALRHRVDMGEPS